MNESTQINSQRSALEEQRDALAAQVNALNAELAETNKGVVALYAELDDQAEALRQVSELKSRFLSYMSHEFRTPLGSIRSIARILLDRLDGPLTPEQQKQVQFVASAAAELSGMVDDLLDLAKVEAGRITISPAWFEMVDLFSALRGMFRPILTSETVNLVFEEPVGVTRVYTDNAKLSQILRNFISNALKFTTAGEVRVAARGVANAMVQFSVSDTGIGIDKQYHSAIFEDFVQVDSPIQKRLRGTGLGLSLSKKLATLLGGSVAVQSELGVGSTFSLTIPSIVGRVAGATAEETGPPNDGTVIDVETAATILVIDDNPAGRYATARVLRANGFNVIEAATGMQGVALAAEADLVVLDVQLPDINGFEVCGRIRSSTRTSRIPVIHLSATFVKDTDKVEGLDAGADGYLTHPVEPPVLVATVNAFLRARRAEDEMRQSDAKFKAIFDQAMSGILLVSRELVFLEANPRICQILGRPREQIIGRHASSFVPAAHEHDPGGIARELNARGSWHGILPMIRSDLSLVELEWSIAEYSLPGVRLAMVNDITDRRAYEAERERLLAAERVARAEAERANRLKDEFLATLSHELRTPLNAIVGWSQILKTGDPTPQEITEGIDAIERNAQSQTQLISDLLDVSRITSGNLRLDIRPYDPAAVIRAALETMSPAIQAKKIKLVSALPQDTTAVLGDCDRIQQIIWNLLNNAVKFTPEGGTIHLTLARDASGMVFTISDNGQGIEPEFLPHIFERFRQQNAGTRRNQGGLGLGLAIAKHLVEMHGGTIEAKSDGRGKGATFSVRLPIISTPPQHDAEQRPREQTDGNVPVRQMKPGDVVLDGVKVLLVEDDPDARAVFRRVLTTAGAIVREAAEVQTALSLLAQESPNVLISDLGMPNQDGYDLIRKIRASRSDFELPAIALTAFARNEDCEKAKAAGFQVHLSKPVNAAALLAAVVQLSGLKVRTGTPVGSITDT